MRMKKLIAGLALGMSLVMSVNAFAAPSITGVIENPVVEFEDGTDDSKRLEIVEEFEAPYYAAEEGAEIKKLIDEINSGSKTITEGIPELKKDHDVTVDIGDLSMLTAFNAAVIKDQDGNFIEEAKNVVISFDVTNIPDNAELYVLTYDATEGFAVHKVQDSAAAVASANVRRGAALGDSLRAAASVRRLSFAFNRAALSDSTRAVIDGNTISILFKDIKGAAFSVLYKTSGGTSTTPGDDDNHSSSTGAGHVLPVALAAIAAGSAVVVLRKKRA